jgi:hypothetical protein
MVAPVWDGKTKRCVRVWEGHPVLFVNAAWCLEERPAVSCGERRWDPGMETAGAVGSGRPQTG